MMISFVSSNNNQTTLKHRGRKTSFIQNVWSLFVSYTFLSCISLVHASFNLSQKSKHQRRKVRQQKITRQDDTSSTYATCPRIRSITSDGPSLNGDDNLDPNNHRFNEISGIAFSSTQLGPSDEPILYVINDGPTGRLGVYDSGSGRRLRTWDLTSTLPLKTMRDWEDMTYGSCGYIQTDKDDTSKTTGYCIYIGDVGDNLARAAQGIATGRNDEQPYQIIKIQEPIWKQFDDNQSLPSSMITTLSFNYFHPDSPTSYADCEAIFLDYNTGDLYLLPKWDYPASMTFNRLFLLPAEAWSAQNRAKSFSVIPIDLLHSDSDSSSTNTDSSTYISNQTWTRADMSSDGSLVTLGTYDDSYLFVRCFPGDSVADIFHQRRCRRWDNLFIKDARQFESSAFTPDGSRVLQLSECRPKCDPPMIWTKLLYPTEPSPNSVCITVHDDDSTTTISSSPSVSSNNNHKQNYNNDDTSAFIPVRQSSSTPTPTSPTFPPAIPLLDDDPDENPTATTTKSPSTSDGTKALLTTSSFSSMMLVVVVLVLDLCHCSCLIG
jgi:hypothetical protein